MRTFVAIDIPDEIRSKIRDLIVILQPAAPQIRWARPEGLHITLKFLGEVSPGKLEKIQATLATVRLPSPIPLRVHGAGYFPNERSPRVIWLGIEGGKDLVELVEQVEEKFRALGFPTENRPFSGHLTLGRLRVPGKIAALQELLRQQEPLSLGSFSARELFLYESKLSPGGSEYIQIARFEFARVVTNGPKQV